MTRVLVIALQEVTRDLIDPWVDQGLLPNFAALMQAGASGYVRAQAPLITPHSWANILTGVDAGKHGVFDHWQRGADGKFNETSMASLQAPPIWSWLRDTGLRSTLLNVPMTWPLPELDGVVLAGRADPVRPSALFAPPEMYDRLVAAQGAYVGDATAPGGRTKDDYIGLFDVETPRTADAFELLLNAEDWDFAMVYLIDAAMAQHYFWSDMAAGGDNPHRDIILSAYQNLDTAIGRFVRAAGRDAAVFVMSECGAGPMVSGINLNLWLEQQGWLRSKRGVLVGLNQFVEEHILPTAKRLLPAGVKSALGDRSSSLKNWASSSGTQLDLHWSSTKLFSRGKEGNIFVNLKGRDPHGVVQPGDEYEELLAAVSAALYELKNPVSGAAVVTSVSRPAQLYDGPAIDSAPDLIIDWADAAYMMTERGRSGGDVFVERYRKGMSWPTTGSHRYDGALFASGPGVAPGTRLGAVSQFDLLPTWLRMLGRPVPTQLQGRVLTELAETE